MPTLLRAALAAGVLAVAGCDAPQQISDSGYGAFEVSLASWGDAGFAVAWYDTRDGNAEVYLRFLEAAGRPIGSDYRLTHTSEESYEPDIAAFERAFAVAWYEKNDMGDMQARLGAWSLDLVPQWTHALGQPGNTTRNPVVRAVGDGLFAAWIERDRTEQEQVRAGWFARDGTPRGEPVALGPAGANTWKLNAAVDRDGIVYVAYDARVETRADELVLAEVAPQGVTLTRLTADDGRDSKYPDIDFADDGRVALAWFDERDGNDEVYLAVGSLAELRADVLAHARRVTHTPGESIGAYLAWNGDRIGLAWSDDSEGGHEIYFEPFAADGTPLAAARRLTMNSTSSLIPAIKPWRDGFALAWNEVTPGQNGAHDPTTRSEVMLSFTR